MKRGAAHIFNNVAGEAVADAGQVSTSGESCHGRPGHKRSVRNDSFDDNRLECTGSTAAVPSAGWRKVYAAMGVCVNVD
jgi:hypothetical protein